MRSRGIVFVSHSGERTGAPVVLSRLFRWALTGAHEDAYLVFRDAGPLAEACGREFPARVFVVAETSPRALSRLAKPFRKGRDLVRLVRLFRRLRPAVVVVNSLINSLAVVAGRLVGAKVVLWVHEVPGAARDPLALRSRLNRRAHVGLGVSGESCDALRAVGLPSARVDRLPHGLDLAAWAPPDVPRAAGAGLTLGALAVWSPNKRPDLVLETAIAVALARPEVPVELRLGGPEDAEAPGLLARTRARHPTLPPNLRVQVVGPVEDAPRFYQGLDALLVTSDRESLPTVVLEALASGVPAFSFADLPGVREVLGEGGAAPPGLAATRSGPALAATVVAFFYGSPQPATLQAWREAARERARQFSLERQWQALRVILDRIP